MRRVAATFAALFLLAFLTGCPADARIKRQASLLNVKTAVASEEFKAAATPEAKVKVAETWFENAPKMTQVLDDYLQGKKPQAPKPPAPPVSPTPP
jgi:hypothetical protein